MTGYTYEGFTTDDITFGARGGPCVGENAPDVRLTDTCGKPHRLLDFEADFLVLEIGSITCPLFQTRRQGMMDLQTGRHDVECAVLDVREAHPGAASPAHRTRDNRSPAPAA